MVSCAVLDCNVNRRKNPDKRTFHRFPADPVLRNKWIRIVNRQNWSPQKYSTICSKHFAASCFLVKANRQTLKKGSIPTENVPVKLPKARPVPSYVYRDLETPPPSTSQLAQINSPRKVVLKKKCRKLKGKIQQKQKTIRNLRAQKSRLKKKVLILEEVVKKLQSHPGLRDYQNEISVACSNGILQKLVDRCNDKKRGIVVKSSQYEEDLKKFALTLNFYSPRCYRYIRDEFSLCLPHTNTLRNWYKHVNCEPGFTSESLDTIANYTKEKKLYVTLMFDEMSVREHVEFVNNKHYGNVNFGNNVEGDEAPIANQVLVFLVVAINSFWKLPVGFFPGRSFTASQKANLLKICLYLLAEVGCEVMAITFDGIASNITMCTLLGANLKTEPYRTHFVYNSRKYYVLLDPCHLLKLIRNTFGDKKVLFDGNGNSIKFDYITMLHDIQIKEGLKLGNKLSFRHINYVKQKMKVKLAAQLLSRSVAVAIEFCLKTLKLSDFVNSEATVKFLLMVNDVFDIFNSINFRSFGFKKPLCSLNQQEIFNKLDIVCDYFKDLKFAEGERVIDSVRRLGIAGFVMNTITVKWLYVKYIETGHLKFIPMYKLSQDHIETFFSAIRSRGGFNNNPTVRSFISSYKRLICHTEVKISDKSNCLPLDSITIFCDSKTPTAQRINCSIVFNKMTKEFELNSTVQEPESPEEMSSHYWIFPDSTGDLSKFIQSIVEYIAGFVVKRIKRYIHCAECIESLETSRKAGNFIDKKDFDVFKGFLIYPSEDVYRVCLKTEEFFRINMKSKHYVNEKAFDKAVLSIMSHMCMEGLFFALLEHTYDQDPLNSHRYLIIKYIVESYLTIRLKYECTLKNISKETCRQQLNKLVLFQGL